MSIAPLAATASDFVDTRLTFSLADDNVFAKPADSQGQGFAPSPTVPNNQPTSNVRLFFDDFERRNTGLENLTNLTLYAEMPGFFEGLTTEAALLLRMEVLDETPINIREDGSYIRLVQAVSETHTLELTLFPVSADRFRLGYSYDISWGGSAMFPQAKATPGARIGFSGPGYETYVGFKSAWAPQVAEDGVLREDTVWGVLGGAGFYVLDELKLELGGGFFHRGTFRAPDLQDVPDSHIDAAPWRGYGLSAQVSYNVGLPVGQPIDFRLYRNDPVLRQHFFAPETYDGGLSFLLQTEASVLGQDLQDPETPSRTETQLAMAADLTARVKWNKWRFFGLVVFRTPTFILFNRPSLVPWLAFPETARAEPEVFVSVGADYFIKNWHLTPGLMAGIQWPARVTMRFIPDESLPPIRQTFVFRPYGAWSILDAGDRVVPIAAGKLTAKWDFSEIVSAIGEVLVQYDENHRIALTDSQGLTAYTKADPWSLGFNLMIRARF